MVKNISKIALIMFVTFLAGLVMTDCVFTEIHNKERAEIEIEEEEEVEINHLILADYITISEDDGGNKNSESVSNKYKIKTNKFSETILGHISKIKINHQNKFTEGENLFILYSSLKIHLVS